MATATVCHLAAGQGPGVHSSSLSAALFGRERRGKEAWLGVAEEKASVRICTILDPGKDWMVLGKVGTC